MIRVTVPGKHQEVIAFAPGKELLLEHKWKSYHKAFGKVIIGRGTQGTFRYSHV